MKDNDLLMVQVILSSVIVLMLTILIVALAVIGDDVKAEVKQEIQAFKTELNMLDFSNVKELVDEIKPLLELAREFNDDTIKHYLREGKNFLQRCDSIDCADRLIWKINTWNRSDD